MTEDEMVGWHHRLYGMSWSKLREMVKDKEAWRAAVHRVTKLDMTEQLNNNFEERNLVTFIIKLLHPYNFSHGE